MKKEQPRHSVNNNISGFISLKWQMIIIAAIAVIFYGNTIFNDYALDDGLVIGENPFTMDGIAGIDDILSHDSYFGFYQQFGSEGELAGGRYRPLSIITFAIEYEFFALNPTVSHAINVLLYALTGIILLLLLNKYIFRQWPILSFLTTLIFIIHPIHTEVVANIKGRDEILSLLLLLFSLYYLFKYMIGEKQVKYMAVALAAYFLALLSKENGITFLAVIPVAIFCFTPATWARAFRLTAPFFAIGVLYLLLRYTVVGTGAEQVDDVMNDPFAFAGMTEKYATIIYILLLYLKLLIFPHPLSYDYGFSQIAYKDPADVGVIFSVLLHLGLLVFAFVRLRKGAVLPFAILFYFFTLSIVSNLFVDLGGTMGERLIYHSSLGFAIAVAYIFIYIFRKINIPLSRLQQPAGWIFIGVLVVLSGYKTIARNQDWKNNTALFMADVEVVPNSVKANVAAATAYISEAEKLQGPEKRKYYETALHHLQKAASIYPRFTDIYLNLGVVYYHLEDYRQMTAAWDRAAELHPNHPKLREYRQYMPDKFLEMGKQAGAAGNIADAVTFLEKAVNYDPKNSEAWYNLGGAYFTLGKLSEAENAFVQALQLEPDHQQAQQGLNAVRARQLQ